VEASPSLTELILESQQQPAHSTNEVPGTGEVLLVCAVACIGAGLASGAPTGLTAWDAALRALFVLALVVLGQRVRPLAWLTFAALTLVVTLSSTGTSYWLLGAVGAGLVALMAQRGRMGAARSGRLAGAGMGIALLHLPAMWFWGAPSLLAVSIGLGVLVASRFWLSASWKGLPLRRVLLVAVTAVVLLGGVISWVGVNAAVGLRDGREEAAMALSAQRQGRADDAAVHWSKAVDSFTDAQGATSGFAAKVLRAVPVVGSHTELAKVLSETGADVARAGRDATPSLDFANWVDASGRIDTAELGVAERAVLDLNAALFDAETDVVAARGPWTLAPLNARVDSGLDLLRDSRTEGEIIAEALRVLPAAVGESEPKEYVVAFANPAEAREMGGLLSAYAVIRFEQGLLSVADIGVNDRLVRDLPKDTLDLSNDYSMAYRSYNPFEHPVNLTGTPDLAEMFRAVRDIFPTSIGRADGLVYMDPYVVEALVGLGSPIRAPGTSIRLNGSTTADYLMRGQYLDVPDTREREEIFLALFDEAVSGLASRLLQSPGRLQRVATPLIEQRRLQAVTLDDGATNDLLERIGLLRSFERTPGADFLAIFQANQGENKLDAYTSKSVDTRIHLDPSAGTVETTMQITVSSTAEAILPESVRGTGARNDAAPGSNRMVLSVYSPHIAVSGELDGEVVTVGTTEAGNGNLLRHAVTFTLEPAGTAVLELDLAGELEATLASPYQLELWQQPLVTTDATTITVTIEEPWRVAGLQPGDGYTELLQPGQVEIEIWAVGPS